jgi:uncharacterized protein
MKAFTSLLMLSLCLIGTAHSADSRPTAQALIKHYNMERIPDEGPWFTLTYRSEDLLPADALPKRYDGARVAGNAIIALITPTEFSALHKLKTDEVWHYYLGDPLQLLILHPDGSGEVVILGPDVLHGQQLQHVVPRDSWQGALPLNTKADAYTVFGDTLAPGFEYSDFEMGYRDELQHAFPHHAELIEKLTRKDKVTASKCSTEL